MPFTPDQIATLTALSNGILPSNGIDAGAAAVNAGTRLAEKNQTGPISTIYLQGLQQAQTISLALFGRGVSELNPEEIHQLLSRLRDDSGAFFTQRRMH